MRVSGSRMVSVVAVVVLLWWYRTVSTMERATRVNSPVVVPPIATVTFNATPAPTSFAFPVDRPVKCQSVINNVLLQLDHDTGRFQFQAFHRPARLCVEATRAHAAETLPMSLARVPATAVHNPVRVDVAAVVPLDTCFGNVWHGTIDFLFPLIDLLIERRVAAQQSALLIVVQLPKDATSFWGGRGVGCPSMAHPPFGFGRDTPTGWFIHRIANEVYVTDPEGTQVALLNPQFDHSSQFVVSRLVFATQAHCSRHPPLNEYPFFEYEGANTTIARRCTPTHKLFRELVSQYGKRSTENPSPTHVLYVDRAAARRKNGRRVVNKNEIMHVLRRTCEPPNCQLTVVQFETMAVEKQIQLVSDADVLVVPRGAASIYAAALRPGAAYMSLFPADGRPVATSSDNFPWWPFPLLRRDLTMRYLPCTSSVPLNATPAEASNCLERSLNFCDMTCNGNAFGGLLRDAIKEVESRNNTVVWPAQQCDEFGRCTYAAQ